MQVPPNSDLTLGMVCVDKTTPGHCVWRMTADERFANPAGIMQGGFLGAFADSAMGAAAVTFVQGRKVFAANAEMKISFLAPVPPGAALWCTAQVVSGGSRVAFVEASIVARSFLVADTAPEAATAATDADAPAEPAEPAPEPEERLVARATSTYIFRPRD
ncbi:MAG TPA: PaaI family thioesterase [Acidimicrobiales bacterium]|nr:PaaI family thioesterase [Acidimicrobiales bacterium]